jgi:hypothetical protein
LLVLRDGFEVMLLPRRVTRNLRLARLCSPIFAGA